MLSNNQDVPASALLDAARFNVDDEAQQASARVGEGSEGQRGHVILHKLHKVYLERAPKLRLKHAVSGVSLTVQPGELLGLLGPSTSVESHSRQRQVPSFADMTSLPQMVRARQRCSRCSLASMSPPTETRW